MSSEITMYENVDPLEFIDKMGAMLHSSGMAGCNSKEQGKIVAWACLCDRKSPFDFIRKNHLIKGKITLAYDFALAEFNRLGGRHKVLSKTPELASIQLRRDDWSMIFSLSWEDAKKEPFTQSTKTSTGISPNYATPLKRGQMLWARVVTDAVKTVMPEVSYGMYSKEELADGDDVDVEVKPKTKARKKTTEVEYKPREEMRKEIEADSERAAIEKEDQPPIETEVVKTVEKAAEPKSEKKPDEEPKTTKKATRTPAEATRDQLLECRSLKDNPLVASETYDELLEQFDVGSARTLSKSDATRLIKLLKRHVELKEKHSNACSTERHRLYLG